MNLFRFNLLPRKNSSASKAKERLQILLAHERGDAGNTDPEFLAKLQKEIIEVVKRHMEIDGEAVEIKLDRGEDISSLEINIEMPGASKLRTAKGGETAKAKPEPAKSTGGGAPATA